MKKNTFFKDVEHQAMLRRKLLGPAKTITLNMTLFAMYSRLVSYFTS